MMRQKTRRWLAALALMAGGIPLITTIGCDPYGLSFFRDDDFGFGRGGGYYDTYVYEDFFYSDLYYDDYYYEDYYYDDYYYDPWYYGW